MSQRKDRVFRKFVLMSEDAASAQPQPPPSQPPPSQPPQAMPPSQPPPPPNNYNPFRSHIEGRHVEMIQKQMEDSKALPEDVESKLVNQSIADLVRMNNELKARSAAAVRSSSSSVPSPKDKEEEDYVTAKLKDYLSPTQFKRARDIVEHFLSHPEKYKVNLKTGQFEILGRKQNDSLIDVVMSLSAASTSKKHSHSNLKNWSGVATDLQETNFPTFLITHAGAKKSYSKLGSHGPSRKKRKAASMIDYPS